MIPVLRVHGTERFLRGRMGVAKQGREPGLMMSALICDLALRFGHV